MLSRKMKVRFLYGRMAIYPRSDFRHEMAERADWRGPYLAVLGGSNPVGGVLAVLAGVPMYADIFGTIPAAEALLYKGAQIAAYGVMTTPALVVDGRVVSYGKILKKEEAKALIHNMRG